MLPFDLMLWAMFGVVLTVVVRVEKRTLDSIGFRQLRPLTIVWGLLLVFGINFVLSPIAMWVVNKTGIPGYEYGLTPLLALPAWYRVFLAVSAGIIEESLYRGYAVERLASLTGSHWMGGLIASVAFGAAHIPGWGIGPALVFLIDGAAATLFYVWRRDLTALVIAHVVGDTIGLVVLPPGGAG
jgi:membrane protease YdiL (CAAX protease family)